MSQSQALTTPTASVSLLATPSGELVVPKTADPALGPRVKSSLIIPTYNEAKNIEPLLTRLQELLDAPLAGSYELIVVDDDSPDKTWEIALRFSETRPHVRVLRRQGEKGLST